MKKKYIKKISSIFTAIALVFTMIAVASKTYADEKKAVVNIKVQDADSFAGVQGATIQVKKLVGATGNDGTVLFTAQTDENGKPVKNESNKSYFNESGDVELPLGSQYEISETMVPSGYYLNQRGKIANLSNTNSTIGEDVTIENTKVDSNDRIISINTASDKKSAFGVKLYKMKNGTDTDPAKGSLIFDGKIDPYDGKLSDSATVGGGYLLNGDLKVDKGHYILKEEKTNRSYKINLTTAMVASVVLLDGKGSGVPSNNTNTANTNANTSGTLTNDPNLDYSILSIRKISSSTNRPLAGATIEVIDNNKKVIFKGKTNSNGVFNPKDATIGKERINDQGAIKLEPGVYFYRETSAPSGYIADTTTHPLHLKKGDIFKVDLVNKQGNGKTSGKNGKLAKTGMESFAPFYVAGGTMLGVGAVMLRNKKRK